MAARLPPHRKSRAILDTDRTGLINYPIAMIKSVDEYGKNDRGSNYAFHVH